jgi:hypothetical protein
VITADFASLLTAALSSVSDVVVIKSVSGVFVIKGKALVNTKNRKDETITMLNIKETKNKTFLLPV